MKKNLLLVIALLATTLSAQPSLVQQNTNFGVNNPTVYFSALTAGDSEFVEIVFPSSKTPLSVLLSGGEGLTLACSSAGNGVTTQIWYYIGVAGGETSVSVSFFPGGISRYAMNASEWSGLGANSLLEDCQDSLSGTPSSNPATFTATPTSSSNLVIAAGGWTSNFYSSGPTNGFTRMIAKTAGAASLEAAYLVQSSATAQQTDWTLSNNLPWATCIAVFGAP